MAIPCLYKQSNKMEFERLKEFGIKLSAADFKQGGKYAGKTYAEAVTEEVKNHNYTGAADKLGQTFSGRLSTLMDTGMQALTTATAPLFDKVAAGMGKLNDKISELTANGTLQQWTDTATQGFNTFWAVGEVVFNGLMVGGKFIIDNWGLIGPIIAGVLAGFMAYQTVTTVIAAVTAAQTALNVVMSANPIGLLVLAIGALVTAGILLWQNWDTIKLKAQELWASMSQAWENMKMAVATKAGELKTVAVNKLNEVWAHIKSIPSQALRWGKDIIKSLIAGFTSIHIPLPHFKIGWKDITVAGKTISRPDFNVDWYEDGGIFNRPSVIGVGESGTEAVVPLENTAFVDKIASAIGTSVLGALQFTQQGGGGSSGSGEVVVQIDSTKLARVMIPALDKEKSRIGNSAILRGV